MGFSIRVNCSPYHTTLDNTAACGIITISSPPMGCYRTGRKAYIEENPYKVLAVKVGPPHRPPHIALDYMPQVEIIFNHAHLANLDYAAICGIITIPHILRGATDTGRYLPPRSSTTLEGTGCESQPAPHSQGIVCQSPRKREVDPSYSPKIR